MRQRSERERIPTVRYQNHTDTAGLTTKRNSTRFKCNICNKRFSSKHCLTEHTYKHTNEKPFTCVVCQMEFRHASQFTLHRKKHKNYQSFTWPRLGEFDTANEGNYDVEKTERQIITMPLITGPKIQLLPLFEVVMSKNLIDLFS